MNKKILSTILVLLFAATFTLLGFFAGTSINVPSNISISLDDEGKLEQFSNSMNQFNKEFAQAMANKTCYYNVSVDDEFYVYAINSYKEVQREKATLTKQILTFCKNPNKIGSQYLEKPRELTYLELNKPYLFNGYELEIVGANDQAEQSLILSVNGVRLLMKEGDTFSNQNTSIYLENLFVSNIPYLHAAGNFVLDKK